jgi:hypothetical protein
MNENLKCLIKVERHEQNYSLYNCTFNSVLFRLQKGLWKVLNKTVPIGCQMNMALSKRLKLNLYFEERQRKNRKTEKQIEREKGESTTLSQEKVYYRIYIVFKMSPFDRGNHKN